MQTKYYKILSILLNLFKVIIIFFRAFVQNIAKLKKITFFTNYIKRRRFFSIQF